jgi:hypothetical protein
MPGTATDWEESEFAPSGYGPRMKYRYQSPDWKGLTYRQHVKRGMIA